VLAHGAVERRPEAEVLAELEQRHLREVLAHQRRRVVAGAVVDDDDVERPALLAEAGQGAAKLAGAVVVGDEGGRPD
jgi:hypothetical protein